MAGWGEEDVGRWLHENGFDEHVEMFKGVCIISSSVLFVKSFLERAAWSAKESRGNRHFFCCLKLHIAERLPAYFLAPPVLMWIVYHVFVECERQRLGEWLLFGS